MMDFGDGKCPFEFNFEPDTFKVGDTVSYRVPTPALDGFPFIGTILAVHDDYIELTSDPNDPNGTMKATRESRPQVIDYQPAN